MQTSPTVSDSGSRGDPAAASGQDAPAAGPRRHAGWLAAPVAIFIGIALMFGYALKTGDPTKLPSALLGKPAPETSFPPLAELAAAGRPVQGFTSTELAGGRVTLVNFWASWCVPCVEEHPMLGEIKARTGIDIYGVNYKDKPEAARRFLAKHGNPFKAVGTDGQGRGAIEWGVYGMPESFIVDGQGRIVYKHVGPITRQSLDDKVAPAIEKARQTAGRG